MKKNSKFLYIIGGIFIAVISFSLGADSAERDRYTYNDLTDDQFIRYRIQNAIQNNHKKKVIDFESTDVQFLSGKTFKLSGVVVFEGILNNKIKKDFECIATGNINETNPSEVFKINLYQEK